MRESRSRGDQSQELACRTLVGRTGIVPSSKSDGERIGFVRQFFCCRRESENPLQTHIGFVRRVITWPVRSKLPTA